MLCDMCGSEGQMYKAIVEGAELTICQKCSKFGRVVHAVKKVEPKKIIPRVIKNVNPEKETMQLIVSDYAEKIKRKRESLGLKQEEFAKKINEKESLVQNIESGHYEPNIELTKKIERFLKIKLIEDYEESSEEQSKVKNDSFTLGDFINVKKK